MQTSKLAGQRGFMGAYLESSKPDNVLVPSTTSLSYSYSFLFQKRTLPLAREATLAILQVGEFVVKGEVLPKIRTGL